MGGGVWASGGARTGHSSHCRMANARLLRYLNVFALDLFQVMPFGCVVTLDFHDILLMRTLVPFGLAALAGLLGAILYVWALGRALDSGNMTYFRY